MSDFKENTALRGGAGLHASNERAQCRGSWLLGSACGSCPACAVEAPRAIEALRRDVADLRDKLRCVEAVVPPRSATTQDLSETVKVALFDAVRGIVRPDQ